MSIQEIKDEILRFENFLDQEILNFQEKIEKSGVKCDDIYIHCLPQVRMGLPNRIVFQSQITVKITP